MIPVLANLSNLFCIQIRRYKKIFQILHLLSSWILTENWSFCPSVYVIHIDMEMCKKKHLSYISKFKHLHMLYILQFNSNAYMNVIIVVLMFWIIEEWLINLNIIPIGQKSGLSRQNSRYSFWKSSHRQ